MTRLARQIERQGAARMGEYPTVIALPAVVGLVSPRFLTNLIIALSLDVCSYPQSG